jgi:recombination associated protein RdgC
MWFKNLHIYRFNKPFDYSAESLERMLQEQAFSPCDRHDFARYGWEPPLGRNGEMLTHSANGCIMICARKQEKILPPAAINEQVEEKVLELEANQGRSVYRKEKRNIREDVVHTLLPRALTRSFHLYACFMPKRKLLYIDTPSTARAEELLEHLRASLGSLPVVPLACRGDAADIMTRWLEGRVPDGFDLDHECELRNPQDGGNIIRCRGQELESEEILGHVKAGKRVIQLALNWRESIQFILTEELKIKRLKFADRLKQEAESDQGDAAVQFDQDFAVMTLQLDHLVEELLQALGGIDRDD